MAFDSVAAVTRRRLLESAALVSASGFLPSASLALPAVDSSDPQPAFALIAASVPAAILIDAEADTAVRHVARSFADDLERVSGTRPQTFEGRTERLSGNVVIIGVLGQSAAIDNLIEEGRLSLTGLSGQWEAFRQVVVERPYPGVARALVIIGSDRRGAVFGTYDLSERIGVSPWHWFADVPTRRQRDVSIPAAIRGDQPRVRYRGFFINDEAPCLSGWAEKKFGGVNSAMYAHVFELLLRMKGNYLWPAMWAPRAFAADDPQNMVLADAMGVVIGNSHHEPMLRAHDEWHRAKNDGLVDGPWDYEKNPEKLRTFWRGGIERMMSKGNGTRYESLITVGMRGDGDEAMAEEAAVPLLERIVADQRGIIADVTGRPANQTPQVWALYKEVQYYYDRGMIVPDDVTLLFADDNWGQIRRLPDHDARSRSGGYGVYYHFDYVGVPRNYKWLNTNQVEKVWQQMDLAYRRDVRSMWIVNVGDVKPMEYPLGFFMAMAWNPEAFTTEALGAYPQAWAAKTFGAEHASAIGEMITVYSKYAARRKPELIDQNSFPLGGITAAGLDGGEFGAMVAEWDALEARMLATRTKIRPDQRDAYFQIIEFPIAAMSNLYRLYYGAAWNRVLASRNDARANYFADIVEESFRRDGELTRQYHSMNGGKWDGMMSQVHMSYVIWNDPTQQSMPSITRVGGDTPDANRNPRPLFVAPQPTLDGVIAIEAPQFSRAKNAKGLRWEVIPHLSRTDGAVIALPQGEPATRQEDGVHLEYDVLVTTAGRALLTLYLAPTLDTVGQGGVRVGVSIGEGPVQVLQARLEATGGAQDTPEKVRWAQAVCDNAVLLSAEFGQIETGRHTIRVWRLDDNVVLQKLVLSTRDIVPSYLGPASAT